MSKEITIITRCDHPQCRDKDKAEFPQGQKTQDVEVFIYTPGRGRKPEQIKVEMCDEHIREMKDLFSALYPLDQNRAAQG